MRRKNRGTVVWDGGTEDFICRDDRCTLNGVHLVHDIHDTPEVLAARQYLWGWMLSPFERERGPVQRGAPRPTGEDVACARCGAGIGERCDSETGRSHRDRLRSSPEWLATKLIIRRDAEPDRRGAKPMHVKVLDEAILRSVTTHTVKPYSVIESDILNDYGSCSYRRLHRRLQALCEEGVIVRVGEEMLMGYTRPDSPLLADPEHAEEVVWHQLGDLGLSEAA